MRIIIAVLAAVLLSTAAQAADLCVAHKATGPTLTRLEAAMANDRFVSYNPTELKIIDGTITKASKESVRADLTALRPYFNALITYSARDGNEYVADIAAELGYKALIIGLWTPADPEEVRNAIAMANAHPDLVVGLSLGNEIILGKRGTWQQLGQYLTLMRARLPAMPLTVSEPFAQFLDSDSADVRDSLDFMLVNIHPIFEKWFASAGPANWADFVVKVTAKLANAYCGPILVKETGVPSGPIAQGYELAKQSAFWRALEQQMKPASAHAFAYFSAFDAPWRVSDFNPMGGNHPEEAYWGLFTETRDPKPVIEGLSKLK
jgi:glucan 1,3-beta-glucosidase